MIELQNLSKKEGKVTIFEDINCKINEGEIVAILGKNSSGKTVLLDMIIGLKRPNTGNILIDDKDIFEDIFDTRRKIGYMSETPLYDDMLVEEYLKFLTNIRNKEEQEIVVNKIIEDFSLQNVKNTLVGNLSKSENKKLAIAGAYIGSSKIILLDEPFIGLDIADVENVLNYIKNNKSKFTTIIATHSVENLEEICERVIIINKGKIVSDKYIKDLKKENKDLKTLFLESTKEKGEKNEINI